MSVVVLSRVGVTWVGSVSRVVLIVVVGIVVIGVSSSVVVVVFSFSQC